MRDELEQPRDGLVNPVWKWIAMISVGILLGGMPAYISLELDAHSAVTRKDVDGEIIQLNAPIVTELTDLKDQVKDLTVEIHELRQSK